MIIRDMFYDDINRSVNSVVKVGQDAPEIVSQEIREYVVTKELKKHFHSFFESYASSFDAPPSNIGVWISGNFGSGKSHFLKILSYLLENKEVDGIKTVERFRDKFEEAEDFALVEKSTQCRTEAILFNIDVNGVIKKDNTAIIRVFAKVFYDHLGFYGDNLKVALLEEYIDECGKTEEFRRVFEEKKGVAWTKVRNAFKFHSGVVAQALAEVLGTSEADAKKWFDDKSEDEFSIKRLVKDVKRYVDKRRSEDPNFRLLFMADEVGQYVGDSTDMLLNLQTLTEQLGTVCQGAAWIVCTAQEAIDQFVVRVRTGEFSRIQDRFPIRLSLSSSSVAEVIQKRILRKKDEATQELESLYAAKENTLRNLLTFTGGAVSDMRGYRAAQDFAANYPFVPYQFILLKEAFEGIKIHSAKGKNMSTGERSMLASFQLVAQKIQDGDEKTLAPFYLFFDTESKSIDSNISAVINRCQDAADKHDGLEQYDVDVLKLLYLVRYTKDVPSTTNNIAILMADQIDVDIIQLREKVKKSLERLLRQNYVGRAGETYNFLTDEEQDIQREIQHTPISNADIVNRISKILFGDIYDDKKFRYVKNKSSHDFEFGKMIDGNTIVTSDSMALQFFTANSEIDRANDVKFMTESAKDRVVIVLDGTSYFEDLENAMKIETYAGHHAGEGPESVRAIVAAHQAQAKIYREKAVDALRAGVVNGDVYAAGERLNITSSSAKEKINKALEYLVGQIYRFLGLIEIELKSPEEARKLLLNGEDPRLMAEGRSNQNAAKKVEEFLTMQDMQNKPVCMSDIQDRYQKKPYGWRPVDVAGVMATLIHDQKVEIRYSGDVISPNDKKMFEILNKKSLWGYAAVSLRKLADSKDLSKARSVLREYFDVMNIPEDEDGFVKFAVEKFTAQRARHIEIQRKYLDHPDRPYPGKNVVDAAVELAGKIISLAKDHVALIAKINSLKNELLDAKEDMQDVEGFFSSQVKIFDGAVTLFKNLQDDREYLRREEKAYAAFTQIDNFLYRQEKFNYRDVPKLNDLMAIVRDGHNRLLAASRDEASEFVRQCEEAVLNAAQDVPAAQQVVDRAIDLYAGKREQIEKCERLTLLDAMTKQLVGIKDDAQRQIEKIKNPPKPKPQPVVNPTPINGHPTGGNEPVDKQPKEPVKVYQKRSRQIVFPIAKLKTEEEIDAYLDKVGRQLKKHISNGDGVELC